MKTIVYTKNGETTYDVITEKFIDRVGLQGLSMRYQNFVFVDELPEDLRDSEVKDGKIEFVQEKKEQREQKETKQAKEGQVGLLKQQILDKLILGEDVSEERNTLINLLRSIK